MHPQKIAICGGSLRHADRFKVQLRKRSAMELSRYLGARLAARYMLTICQDPQVLGYPHCHPDTKNSKRRLPNPDVSKVPVLGRRNWNMLSACQSHQVRGWGPVRIHPKHVGGKAGPKSATTKLPQRFASQTATKTVGPWLPLQHPPALSHSPR